MKENLIVRPLQLSEGTEHERELSVKWNSLQW